MAFANELEKELAYLIVEVLNLEDVDPEEIDPEASIFGDGLGLDSIDALEIAMAISKKYGVKLKSDDENNREIFSSLRSLAEYVEAHKGELTQHP